jgi:hypothetical protein
LSGALHDPDDVRNEVVGTLDVVTHYKTPYTNKQGKLVLLCFALGNAVSCNKILGLPAIKSIEMMWNISQGAVVAEGAKELLPSYDAGGQTWAA